MINTVDIMDAFLFVSLVFFIFYMYFVLYKEYRLDKCRDKLFALRLDLLEKSLQSGIKTDDEAYVLIRDTINSFIRFAHHLSVVKIIALYRLSKKIDIKSFTNEFNESCDNLTSSQIKILQSSLDQMHDILIAYLFKAEPFVMFLGCVCMLIKERISCKVIRDAFNSKLKNCIDKTSFDGIVHDTVYSPARAA